MTIRRVTIYKGEDRARALPLEPAFHLRAASALEVARVAHYGEHGTFSTNEAEMIADQPFQNDDAHRYPWDSPRYVSITTDDPDAAFAEIEATLKKEAAARDVAFVRMGAGEYDIDSGAWVEFRNETAVLPQFRDGGL